MPSILKISTFWAGFTSILQSVCAFLKQDRALRQADSQGTHSTHTHPLLTLVIPWLQCAASINTRHSCPSLCTFCVTVLRKNFMEGLSHFPPFLQAFQRGGSCAYNVLERPFLWITFNHYDYHLQWDGRLQLDLSFWRT